MLHAFSECRNRTGDGCTPTAATQRVEVEAGICYTENSSDDGATWSKIWNVKVGATEPAVICDGTSLILQYNSLEDTSNWQIISQDKGATWSEPQSIVLGQYGWANVGPGRGLQLSDKSPAPGRLLFIGHHGPYQYDLVWYSDDGGKTYTLSETVLEKMDEAQLVELANGSVMANMRNDHLSTCFCRAVAISNDGGKSFGNIIFDPTLISPVCMASILSMSNGSLIFANPESKKQRINGMVRRSDDSGKTWPYSWLVTEEEYAYSCLTHVASPEQVGLLWETGAPNCTGPSCQLVFSKITVL